MIQNSSAVETKQFLPLELIIEPVQLENFCPLMFVTILKGPAVLNLQDGASLCLQLNNNFVKQWSLPFQ